MKQLFTSYYAKHKSNPMTISISAGPPDWYSGRWMQQLAPTWDMVMDSKRGRIDFDQYKVRYLAYLNSRFTPQEVADMFEDQSILLCYEVPSDNCHRHILAEWLNAGADVVVTEWAPPPTEQELFINSVMEF